MPSDSSFVNSSSFPSFLFCTVRNGYDNGGDSTSRRTTDGLDISSSLLAFSFSVFSSLHVDLYQCILRIVRGGEKKRREREREREREIGGDKAASDCYKCS